jgi:NitT/TauT family transport system permease protein
MTIVSSTGETGPAGPKDASGGLKQQQAHGESRWVNAIYAVVSLALLLVLWQFVSLWTGSSVLPGPWATFQAATSGNPYVWSDIGVTAERILGAFGMAFVAAVIFGVAIGTWRVAERLFGPWVTITASVPALVFIVVAFLAGGLSDTSAMIGGALVVAPSMTFAVWDGTKAISPELGEMARAFGVSRRTVLRKVVLPQTAPFLFVAARTGLSLTWRIMIFVELIGRSSGVGYRIQYWYNLFDMRRVLGAAAPFCVLMLLVEFVILRPLERRIFRWRRREVR